MACTDSCLLASLFTTFLAPSPYTQFPNCFGRTSDYVEDRKRREMSKTFTTMWRNGIAMTMGLMGYAFK